MALGETARFRSFIQDPRRIADVVTYGDGTAALFTLAHANVLEGTAFVPGPGGWSATGATFNTTGFVELATAISANSALRLRYEHSVFSNDEIGEWFTHGGSFNNAARLAILTLQFDGLRRAKWTAPDGTSFDDTAALARLRELYDLLGQEDENAAIAGGAVGSWSLDQEQY